MISGVHPLQATIDKWHYEKIHSAKIQNALQNDSLVLIGGGDEAGRGCLAGPVVAAIVVLDRAKNFDERIDDSKKLNKSLREELYAWIIKNAIIYSIASVNAKIIDKVNILQATKMAFSKAFTSLHLKPQALLLDAITLPDVAVQQTALIKGESKSHSIAAASILAKVYRDKLMIKYSRVYPQYQFEQHKGYGVKVHLEKLFHHGPCPLHRYSYKPVQKAFLMRKNKV